MNNLKRLLTMAMAVAMVMSLFVVGTTATFTDQSKIQNDTAVDMNVALNIINGRTDGSFDPQGTVTRAEMVKMICIVLNGGNEPILGAKVNPTYTDIQGHWAEAYIEYCTSMGIVAGMGDGTFVPDGKVTGTQAAKMLLVALGYEANTEGFNGDTWAVKINVAASQKDLYNDVNIDPNAPLSRDDAAQMVWNALNAVQVEYDYKLTTVNGVLTTVQVRSDKASTETLLSVEFDAFKTEDVVMESYSYDADDAEYTYTFAGVEKAFKSDNDYSDLFAMPVTIVTKTDVNGKVFGMFSADAVVLATGLMADIDSIDTEEIEFDDETFDVDASGLTAVPQNNYGADNTNVTNLNETADANGLVGKARLIDTDDNGDVDVIVYLPFTAAEVTFVNNKKVNINNGVGILEFEDHDIYDGIEKDDYVVVYDNANIAGDENIVLPMDSIDGTVTGLKSDEVAIDGTWYAVEQEIDVDVNEDYTFYTVNDAIYFAEEGESTNTIDDIAFVEAVEAEDGLNDARAKLIFADGSKKIVTVDEINDSDDFSADDINALKDTMVTFTERNGEYSLEVISSTNDAGYDSYKDSTAANTTTNVTAATSDREGVFEVIVTEGENTTKATYTIADDAVVFLKEGNDYEVITGATLNNLKLAVAGEGTVLSNETNGVDVAEVIALSIATLPSDRGTTDNYGYVIDSYNGTFDGDDAVVINVWNAEFGKEEVLYKVGTGTYNAGDIIVYDLLADNEVENVSDAGGAINAITAVKEDEFIDFDGDRYYFTEDTQYIFCDTENDEDFMDDGSVVVADEEDINDYIENAYVLVDEADEILLIVVDINNEYK